jgi:hypothetical protein
MNFDHPPPTPAQWPRILPVVSPIPNSIRNLLPGTGGNSPTPPHPNSLYLYSSLWILQSTLTGHLDGGSVRGCWANFADQIGTHNRTPRASPNARLATKTT